MKEFPKIIPFGEWGVLLQWASTPSERLQKKIRNAQRQIQNHFGDALFDLVPAYDSLAVYFRKPDNTLDAIHIIKELFPISIEAKKKANYVYKVPVCYDPIFGWDLNEVAQKVALTVDQVIALHSKRTYPVYFIGFLPGFPYFGGLDEKLEVPRKMTPRSRIEAGSVAIGGRQTGVYPSTSPGGWNVIGRTPIPFFDINKEPPSLLTSGDKVQFFSITKTQYEVIEVEIAAGIYKIEREVYDD